VRSKLKNFITNNTVDKTWRAGESVDLANVEKKETQFTYAEGDEVGGCPAGAAVGQVAEAFGFHSAV
jgi:hypothetical protein